MTLEALEKSLPLDNDAQSFDAAMTPAASLRMVAVDPLAWDDLCSQFDGAVQEQLFTFASKRWPGVKCEPWLFEDNDRGVGGGLAWVQPRPLGLGAIAVGKWAPIFKHNDRPDAERIYRASIEALMREYAIKREMSVCVLPRAVPMSQNTEFDVLKQMGFKPGPGLPYPNRYFVRIGPEDDAIMAGFGQKWRYHLRKAIKAGLTFEEAEADKADIFDTLYQAMSDRKQFADHSAYEDTFDALMTMPNTHLRPKLFFVRHKGEIIAGAVIFTAGETAVYLYGATNDKALPLRAGYFLHWKIIGWLREHSRAKWYDLGGTDGFQGLHQFKKGMVGSLGEIQPVPPMMMYSANLRARVTGWLAFTGRELLSRFLRRLQWLKSAATRPDQDRG